MTIRTAKQNQGFVLDFMKTAPKITNCKHH